MGGNFQWLCQWYSLEDISGAFQKNTPYMAVIFQTDNVANYSLSE